MISPLLIQHPVRLSSRAGFPGQVLRAKAVTELVKHRKVPRAVHVCLSILWGFNGDFIEFLSTTMGIYYNVNPGLINPWAG